jgi:2-iminoacetate synthase ThiH
MYCHVEAALNRARHLHLIRGIQKETNGFTEFVPLSFIAVEAPIFKKSLIPGMPARARDEDVLRMYPSRSSCWILGSPTFKLPG